MRAALLCVGLAAMAPAPAAAQPAQQPWAIGVTPQQRASAEALLGEGNQLFVQKKIPEALAKYQEAIKSFDHPAIRFNIVRCLLALDRLPEAAENLKLALKFGPDPLEESVYEAALNYEKLLAQQVGELTVSCSQRGARVSVDGQAFITACPASATQRVKPGHHQVVATLDGHLTRTLEVVVVGGDNEKVDVVLKPLATAGVVTHRFATWIPWVVIGGGAMLGVLATSIQLNAVSEMESYKKTVDACGTAGCLNGELDTSSRDDARANNQLAISLGVIAGAVVVTGGILAIMNRGRLVIPKSVERVGVTPLPGGAGMAWSTTF